MDRLMLISADCHFGLPMPEYKKYLPRHLHLDLDDWYRSGRTTTHLLTEATKRFADFAALDKGRLNDEQAELAERLIERFNISLDEATDWVQHSTVRFGRQVCDAAEHIKIMEADGVCAEVVIQQQDLPFWADAAQNQDDLILGIDIGWDKATPQMMMEGARAYHRAVVDFVSAAPERMIGLPTIPTLYDVDRAIEELTWAAQHGLKGVLLPATEPRLKLPPLFDPRYDRFWAACVDLEMPVHWHVGPCETTYGMSKYSGLVANYEIFWWGHRPLWHLMFGGVLKNYPKLQLVFTELAAQWVPRALESMDAQYIERPHSYGAVLPAKPSEIWRTNCHLGASCMSRAEAQLASQIGVETMMFGTDFPHQEMTWPHSGAYLNKIMHGLPESDIRAICGENAARLYGFDVAKLSQVADHIGHRMEDILSADGEFVKARDKYPWGLNGNRFSDVL